jgi:hypothetical protein
MIPQILKLYARRGALLLALLLPAVGFAEGEAPAEGVASVAAAKSAFEKTERMEALRYRHLWIAYGTIWFLVFGFTYRTWKRSEATSAELDDLKRRLAELEGRNG